MTTILRCSGCGVEVAIAEPLPFRCPRAASPGEHVLARRREISDADQPSWPAPDDPEDQPFVRYRELLHPYAFARSHGIGDQDYVALVRDLDDVIAGVDGRGFRRTPLRPAPALDARLQLPPPTILLKDETVNVAGSHKGRHLFGVAVQIALARRAGVIDARPPRLAIASCGNAALAAAVIARATGWPLTVYVPPDADHFVLGYLADLGVEIVPCARRSGDPPGDPCVRRFREAVADGALPFSCQGPDNGLAVDGVRTLAYEILEGLDTRAPEPVVAYVQVGGGALASGLAAGFEDAATLGVLGHPPGRPRLVTVQTEGCAPLARAYRKLAAAARAPETPDDAAAARIDAAMAETARRRDEYMWPWGTEPASAATGILDDETYDWWAVVRAMLATGGDPVVAPERVVRAAHDLAPLTGIAADATGTAGLAGLLTDLEHGRRPPPGAAVVLLFTGAARPATPPRPRGPA